MQILRPKDAAAKLGISISTLAQWRCRGEGPPFVKLSPTVVGYSAEAVDKWLAERTFSSTAEAIAEGAA